MRPIRARLAALLLAALAGCSRPPPSAAPVPPLTAVSIQADWYAEAEQGGFYQAVAKGFYRQAGLDATIVDGGPGCFPLQKVASGQADFGLGRSDDVILAVANGHVPLVIVCAYMERDPMSVLVHADGPVRDFPDLAGRAVMADPSSAWIPYLEAKYGIHIGVIPLNYGLAEFAADRNFIQQGFVTNEPYYLAKRGVAVRTLLIAGAGYRPYRVVYANAVFARTHPDAVRAFVQASIRGWHDFLEGDPGPARAAIAARNRAMTPDFLDYGTRAIRDFGLCGGDARAGERIGLITPERLQSQVDLFVRLKILPAPLPLGQFVSFDYLPSRL